MPDDQPAYQPIHARLEIEATTVALPKNQFKWLAARQLDALLTDILAEHAEQHHERGRPAGEGGPSRYPGTHGGWKDPV